jgi:2-dehydro-3-deoxygalactonokinase
MRIVAIDTGTTNTKVWVVADGEVRSQVHGRAGVRDVAGSRDHAWLAAEIRRIAEGALSDAGMVWSDVEAMVGFGMLTSELGLEEVPHLQAPVGVEQLAGSLRERRLADDIAVPLYLIPGVVCTGTPDYVHTDFMRGEETQVVGLLGSHALEPPLLYVSPGSHTKFVTVNREGRIAWSFTTLSGELVWALSQETILRPLLDPAQPLVDPEAADRGAQVAREVGLSRALYMARLSNRLDGFDASSCTDFIRGAIAATDVDGLRQLPDRPSVVALGAGSALGAFYERFLAAEPWARRVERVNGTLGPLGAWMVYLKRPTETGGSSCTLPPS